MDSFFGFCQDFVCCDFQNFPDGIWYIHHGMRRICFCRWRCRAHGEGYFVFFIDLEGFVISRATTVQLSRSLSRVCARVLGDNHRSQERGLPQGLPLLYSTLSSGGYLFGCGAFCRTASSAADDDIFFLLPISGVTAGVPGPFFSFHVI